MSKIIKLITFVAFFSVFFSSFILNNNKNVSASDTIGEFYTGEARIKFSKEEEHKYAEFYYAKYGEMFGDETNVYTNKGNKLLRASMYYLPKGHLIFGTPSDVSGNDKRPVSWGLSDNGVTIINGKAYRYLGLTYKGLYKFTSNGFVEDWSSWGDTVGRNYRNWRTCNFSSTVMPDCHNLSWNSVNGIMSIFNNSGIPIDSDTATEFYNQQLDNILDHYGIMYSTYIKRDKLPYFKSRPADEQNVNTFATHFTREQKKNIAMIIQPSTEANSGRMIEWHSGCGGTCYDVFEIASIPGVLGRDFKAVSLVATPVGAESKLSFTVKYLGKKEFDTEKQVISKLYLTVNGEKKAEYPFLGFDNVWQPNEEKTYTLPDTINLSYFGENDDIEIVAMFNYDGGVKENTLLNNSASVKIKGLDDTICYYNGYGEVKTYEEQVCTAYGYTSKGRRYCKNYACESRTYDLKYGSEVKYDKKRQDLMGLWSSNSYGHLNLGVPGATVSYPSENKWKQFIEGHKVPGVDNIRRVLRAGRSIQLYGTVSVKITLEDYTKSGLATKRDKFYNALTKHSIIEGNDEGAGKVHNNVDKTDNTVAYDSTRAKVQGKYITYEEGSVTHSSYGFGSSSSGKTCTVIDVYTQTFEFELPLRSNNVGGEQITTAKGDFYTNKNYNVANSKTDSYFVDIDTMNGVHSVNFVMKMYEIFKEVDSSFSGGTKLCKSLPEKFGIQGNIYDDVRVKDVTDEEKGKNNFNF